MSTYIGCFDMLSVTNNSWLLKMILESKKSILYILFFNVYFLLLETNKSSQVSLTPRDLPKDGFARVLANISNEVKPGWIRGSFSCTICLCRMVSGIRDGVERPVGVVCGSAVGKRGSANITKKSALTQGSIWYIICICATKHFNALPKHYHEVLTCH